MRTNPTAQGVINASIIIDGKYIDINEVPSGIKSYYSYINISIGTALTEDHKSKPMILAFAGTKFYFSADL